MTLRVRPLLSVARVWPRSDVDTNTSCKASIDKTKNIFIRLAVLVACMARTLMACPSSQCIDMEPFHSKSAGKITSISDVDPCPDSGRQYELSALTLVQSCYYANRYFRVDDIEFTTTDRQEYCVFQRFVEQFMPCVICSDGGAEFWAL